MSNGVIVQKNVLKEEEPTHSNTSGLWLPTEYEGCGDSAGRNI